MQIFLATFATFNHQIQGVQDEIAQKKSKRKTSQQKYSEEDCFKIGKYASENGATPAVRKFKNS